MRVYLTNGSLINSSAISISLFAIVMTSVLTGTALPFGLAKLGVDPANAGTSIQVSELIHDPQRFRLQAVNLYRCISRLLKMRLNVR